MNNIAKQIMAEERELLDAMAVSNRLQRTRLPTGCTPCSSCGVLVDRYDNEVAQGGAFDGPRALAPVALSADEWRQLPKLR
jgi:hypothetical protein